MKKRIKRISAGNATSVQRPIVIPSVIPEQYIFQSGGLNAALQPAPYIHHIKPLFAKPELRHKKIIYRNYEKMPKNYAGEEEDQQLIELKVEEVLQVLPNLSRDDARRIAELPQEEYAKTLDSIKDVFPAVSEIPVDYSVAYPEIVNEEPALITDTSEISDRSNVIAQVFPNMPAEQINNLASLPTSKIIEVAEIIQTNPVIATEVINDEKAKILFEIYPEVPRDQIIEISKLSSAEIPVIVEAVKAENELKIPSKEISRNVTEGTVIKNKNWFDRIVDYVYNILYVKK